MAFGGGANDLTIKVRVDEAGTLSYMNQLDGSIKKVENTAGSAGSGFAGFGAAIGGINPVTIAAGVAIAAVTAALYALPKAIQAASRVADITSSFDKAAEKAGTFGDVLTNQLTNAVDGTVSKLDLLKNSNELLQAGLRPDQIVQLTEATRSFADVLGTDTKGALDAVSDSLLRGNDKALKALGITVDNELATLKYKEANKLLGQQLTETQTVEANRIAVIAALVQKQAELGKATLDSGDALDRITNIVSNFITDALLAVGSNKELAIALNSVATSLSNIDFEPMIDGLSRVIAKVAEAVGAFANFSSDVINSISLIDKFFAEVDKTKGTPLDQILGAGDAAAAVLFGTVIDNVSKKLKDAAVGADIFGDSLRRQREATQKAKDEADKLSKTIKDKRDADKAAADATTAHANAMKAAAEAAHKEAAELVKLSAALDTAYSGETKLQAQLRGILTSSGDATAAIAALGESLIKSGTSAGEFGSAVSSAINSSGELIDPSKLEAPTKAAGQSIGDILGSSIASAAGDALTTLFNGDAIDGKALGASLGSSIGGGIAESLAPGTGPIGAALGSALGSAIGGLFSSKDGPGTAARKQADTFFADLFEANRLSVIINGELVQLKDLVFGSGSTFADGSFDSLFASLPDTARQAFAGVGAAFEELLGVSEDIGGQIAAVLANNLVGGADDAANAINNLQLLLEATGKTAEEMGNAILKAFLDGKLSAEEAQNALAGVQQTLEKGIPGAVGAVGQAFNNMAAAGSRGGRALLDAIGDIGVEAKELGINDFPSLAAVMVNTFGISAQAVANFFEAAKAAGLKSVAELAAASQETLLAVATNVQAIGEGKAPTATPINLGTSTPSSFGGGGSVPSGGSSGGGNNAAKDAADAKREAQKRAREELQKLVTGSDEYKTVLTSLNSNLITSAQAQGLITGLYGKGEAALKSLNGWQKQYNKEQASAKGVTADTAKNLDQAKKAVEQFGDELGKTGDKTAKVNAELLDFITKFRGQTDLLSIAALAAGGSFKDLQKSALDSFLSGALTFQEARAALEDAGQGIAGKRGASGEAFKNLLDFGTKGGRLAVDALRDIGAEAKEIDAQTFEDLRAILLGSGISRQDADKLFVSLANEGISTLDGLATVSDETAAKILAGLQDIGLPFANTSDEIANLNKELAEIPGSKQIDIQLNVDAVYGPGTQDILRAAGIDLSRYGNSGDSPGLPPVQSPPPPRGKGKGGGKGKHHRYYR